MELILIRHGQSEGNVSGGDVPDPPLTALGRRQADSVSRALAAFKPDVLAASPLQRSLQTATPAARALELPIEVWKQAYEVRMGPHFTGPTLESMRTSFPEAVFGEDMEADGWHYRSDLDFVEARQRADRLVQGLRERHAGKRVAIFLHWTFNQLVVQSILGLPTYENIQFNQPNGCISHILFRENDIYLMSLADIRHLLHDGVEVSG